MKGSDYVAVQRLTNRAGDLLAAPGDTCERVPEASLGWLLDRGWIRLNAAAGFHGFVKRPTVLTVADGEPERVEITPAEEPEKE